jgi:hypothetical protein
MRKLIVAVAITLFVAFPAIGQLIDPKVLDTPSAPREIPRSWGKLVAVADGFLWFESSDGTIRRETARALLLRRGQEVSPMCPEYSVTYLAGRTSRRLRAVDRTR